MINRSYPMALKIAAGKVCALTGEARHGGLQIEVYPMKSDVYEALHREPEELVMYSPVPVQAPDMGLAPGGLMRQEIYEDDYGLEA